MTQTSSDRHELNNEIADRAVARFR